ncbi:hypothetical protein ACQP2X_28255 [Actinoplanes sp. CA-131856]
MSDFLAETAGHARRVLAAEDGWPTYEAGLEFQSMAVRAMVADGPPETEGLNLIWGALTDEMDAPGRGSPEQDAEAVRHMKRAATEWLTVLNSPSERAAYLDRWIHDECGYERHPKPTGER